MLVTLADMKTRLNVSGNTFDTFLTEQITLISETIEAYCRRKFLEANYRQTFYREDYRARTPIYQLYMYPVKEITSFEADGTETVDAESYRLHKPTGIIKFIDKYFSFGDGLVVEYTAGYPYANIPAPIKEAVYTLVGERYNKKVSGIDLGFGSDVQSISIPGTISIAYDYSLANNDRSTTFGSILGNTLNLLDMYRSERTIAGSGELEFNEVV